jgi:hypothetical protein
MHGYCLSEVKEKKRDNVIKSLFFLSVIVTPFINTLLEKLINLANNNEYGASIIDWLIDKGVTTSISYMMTYALLYLLVNKCLWSSLLSPYLKIPDLRGVWVGTLESNYNGGKAIDMKLVIKQTMKNISCTAFFNDSSSTSEMAKLVWINDDEIELDFSFKNKTRNINLDQKEYHGYNWFLIRGESMNGCYFTDRKGLDGRNTDGTIRLAKRSKKKFGKTIQEGKHSQCKK